MSDEKTTLALLNVKGAEMNNSETNEIRIYEPESFLREIIGTDLQLKNLFTPEKIASCQKLIDVSRNEFFDNAYKQLKALHGLFQSDLQDFSKILMPVENVKGQAKIFGFPFIVNVCNHISDYCQDGDLSEKKLKVVKKLIEALTLTLKNKVTDEEGTLNKELSVFMTKT
ncbi:MAG: Hpt domain-containing protein [Chitinophagales bacterium]|jgi:hypothetical protein|nr:Hpt domain-containing protein [Chitinophagales bacterium]